MPAIVPGRLILLEHDSRSTGRAHALSGGPPKDAKEYNNRARHIKKACMVIKYDKANDDPGTRQGALKQQPRRA
ncbi:MAG: hypothetical protein ACLTT1_01815 [[Clostridium] scindens]